MITALILFYLGIYLLVLFCLLLLFLLFQIMTRSAFFHLHTHARTHTPKGDIPIHSYAQNRTSLAITSEALLCLQ